MIYQFYRTPALSVQRQAELLTDIQRHVSPDIASINTEWVFYVEAGGKLSANERSIVEWILKETYEPEKFGPDSFLGSSGCIEVGPRLAIVSPWSTNAVASCHACGVRSITRIERARRFTFTRGDGESISVELEKKLLPRLHDRMTEERYPRPITTFDFGITSPPVEHIPVLAESRTALERFNAVQGLGLTDYLIDYLLQHCLEVIHRDVTDAEYFMYGQLNSQHCRHHDFQAEYVIDGIVMPHSPMDLVRQTVSRKPGNVDKAFNDNAGAIARHLVTAFVPSQPGHPSAYHYQSAEYCIIVKVETHNHPTGVEPYNGAATGTGGEIRDRQAFGRGGLFKTALACYYVSHLRLDDYHLPWETTVCEYSPSIAPAAAILIQASNGASNYGNCIGQPIILGTTRSFEQLVGDEMLGYTKPIMVAGGVGLARTEHLEKLSPEKGWLVVQIGGDAYHIGLGGAGRSSVDSGSEGDAAALDFASVQRANPEMEQRIDRVIRTCVELGQDNPIETIQDLGAGGDSVAVPEIVHPSGARIYLRRIPSGDQTMSVMVLVCNESQERLVMLIRPENMSHFQSICQRERCPMAVIGDCTDDGYITFADDDGSTPIHLSLDFLLSKLPQKRIEATRVPRELAPLRLPDKLLIPEALDRVLRLVDVGSKGFLTRKVDRSVGGCVVQQQCVGPLQLTMADYAVTADGMSGLTGAAQSIGEQPIKGIVDNAAGIRMSVAEGLTNIMFAKVNGLDSISCSATWQWPAGHPGEDARLYEAVQTATGGLFSDTLGVRIFVGKDSLSMASKAMRDGMKTVIKAPGTVQFFTVAPMDDVTRTVTPDIKRPGNSQLLFLDFAHGSMRLGGSALARVYNQLGNESPDVDDPDFFKRAMSAVQELVHRGLILAGHDRSDGGLITTLLEMAFAGNCGFRLRLPDAVSDDDLLPYLFNEECGAVIEVQLQDLSEIGRIVDAHGVRSMYHLLGRTTCEQQIRITRMGTPVFDEDMRILRDLWQETSYALDRRQTHASLVESERQVNYDRRGPAYRLSYTPTPTDIVTLTMSRKPRVAIMREAGTNGDREMAEAFFYAGFEVTDVTMTDLADGRITLDEFRGLVLCGGFSNRDVPDAGKSWAAAIRHNERIKAAFDRFYGRVDTFSLGVCNGCQVMTLMGVVPFPGLEIERQPRFIRNTSEIFESRFSTVTVHSSSSIFFRSMIGSVLGIWVAHGEGRLHCPDDTILEQIITQQLAPLRFADDDGRATECYPFNPNGSPLGITALCSPDGRHLAMMPHAERLFLKWQWPWTPAEWQSVAASPWLTFFQNAYYWCTH